VVKLLKAEFCIAQDSAFLFVMSIVIAKRLKITCRTIWRLWEIFRNIVETSWVLESLRFGIENQRENSDSFHPY